MTSFKVDLRTKIIPPDHEVYVARPGKSYRLYDDFIANDLILAELPLLDFAKDTVLVEQPDLGARIRRSKALRSWYRHGQEGAPPSRDLNDYMRKSDSLSDAQLMGVLRGYFDKAKKGDLIVVPPAAYSKDCYVGELTGEPSEYIRHKVSRYRDDYLTGRAVRWLGQIPKRRLPTSVLEGIEKPSAFFLLDRPSRPLIYEIAYKAFVDDGSFTSRFAVEKTKFQTSDDLLIQAFFNFAAANTRAVDHGQRNLLTIQEAAFTDLGDYAPDLKININSPGNLSISSRMITPLIAAALFAIAIEVGPLAVKAVEDGKMLIGNSGAAPGDACTAEVHKQVVKQIKLLGLEKWPKACEIARKAAENTGLKGRATVKKKD